MAASNQTGIFFATAQSGVALKGFPRECRRTFLSRYDPHFSLILLGFLVVAFGTMWILSHQKFSETVSDKQIIQIQERYAQLVLNKPMPPKEEVKPNLPEKAAKPTAAETATPKGPAVPETNKPAVDREKETFVEKEVRKESTRQERQAERAAVAAQVQSSGIFAAITAASASGGNSASAGGGAGVSDLLGASEGVADLNSVKISKGVFAAKKMESTGPLSSRAGARTSDVNIEKQAIRTAEGAQIASSATVSISSEAPKITGNENNNSPERSAASIVRIISRETNRLIRVFENWLKRDPGLHGQIRVRFTIKPDGSVVNVAVVKSTTNNSDFDQIILRYIERWMFPPVASGGDIEIEQPFVFEGHE
jgi:TonB family protein